MDQSRVPSADRFRFFATATPPTQGQTSLGFSYTRTLRTLCTLSPLTQASLTPSSGTMSVRDADKSKPYIPLASGATDGFSYEGKASATCFCGQVQLSLVSLPFSTRTSSGVESGLSDPRSHSHP